MFEPLKFCCNNLSNNFGDEVSYRNLWKYLQFNYTFEKCILNKANIFNLTIVKVWTINFNYKFISFLSIIIHFFYNGKSILLPLKEVICSEKKSFAPSQAAFFFSFWS